MRIRREHELLNTEMAILSSRDFVKNVKCILKLLANGIGRQKVTEDL